jgi:hypothetical protein
MWIRVMDNVVHLVLNVGTVENLGNVDIRRAIKPIFPQADFVLIGR